jgi:hypothetical protein
MRGYFEGVNTPQTELEVAKAINKQYSGYTVTAYDTTGKQIDPLSDGDYDSIHRVRINFLDSDIEASRVILNRNSLSYIYGE